MCVCVFESHTNTRCIFRFLFSQSLFTRKFSLQWILERSNFYSKFTEKGGISHHTLNAPENSQRIKWWLKFGASKKIWPIWTTGDGNCLLHAASLALTGRDDKDLLRRTALYSVLSEGLFAEHLKQRWRLQQTRINEESGLILNEDEWANDWKEIVGLAVPIRRSNNSFGFLEQIHVLALSYVLRRPIIVFDENML